jgi:hypothetical protein
MQGIRIAAALALAIGAAACASTGSAPQGLTPVASLTDTIPVRPPLVGSFQSTMNAAAGLVSAGRGPRVDGTVRLTPGGNTDDQFTVDFNFNSERGAESLSWTVIPGSCGSGELPLVSPRVQARIDVQGNGRARLQAQFRGTITRGRSYHVNLYANDGTDLADVVACANLK